MLHTEPEFVKLRISSRIAQQAAARVLIQEEVITRLQENNGQHLNCPFKRNESCTGPGLCLSDALWAKKCCTQWRRQEEHFLTCSH